MNKRFIAVLLILVMIFVLTGCDSSNYKKATDMYEAGQYAEAASIFVELGDYEDSAAKAKECYYLNGESLMASGDYAGAVDAYTAAGDYNDAADKLVVAQHELMLETYAPVAEQLFNNVWYYNGGDPTLLNRLSFTREAASIMQCQLTGNGLITNTPTEFVYSINDITVTLTLADGSCQEISYIMEGESLKLGAGEYFTPEEVEAGLQGYWKNSYSDYVLGLALKGEHNYYINNGTIIHESASLGYNLPAGQYYYYGPHEGNISITANGVETDIKNALFVGFNILDGKVTLFHGENPCEPASSLPGPDGYNFN